MRPVREITAEEEQFHMEPLGAFTVPRRNPVEPEPVNTIVLKAFRVTGYHPDCDGSLMAKLEAIDQEGRATGWEPTNVGLDHTTTLVVTADELEVLFLKHEVSDGK